MANRQVLEAVSAKLFGPGSMLEMAEETVAWKDGAAPHHRGVAYKVFPNLPQVLPDLFRIPLLRGYGGREFLVYEDVRLTFDQTFQRASEIGHVLKHEFGVSAGDRVAICMRNRPEYILTFIAATSIGATAVPMNSWWVTRELEYGLSHSGTSVLFCDADRLERVKPILGKLGEGDLRHLVLVGDGKLPAASGNPAMHLYEDLLAKGAGKEMPEFPCEKDDNAILMYTSGTTGFPKGVVLTHRGVTHAMNAGVAHGMRLKAVSAALAGNKGGAPEPAADDVKQPAILLNVPLFHATGLHAVFLVSVLLGRKLVMMYKWDPLTALKLVEKEKITAFVGVPTMVLEIMQHPDFDKYDTSSLEAVGGGGAPPPPSMVTDVGKKFKAARPTQGYGMTESNAVICLTGDVEYEKRPTSCGRPAPGVILEIWDESGKALPSETPGRVMIKGASVMKEYWRNPEATAAAITPDGYLDTGDVGRLDEEGYLHLMDRAKDMIIRGGENISCAEVEAAVYDHAGVAEAAVVGVPHPTLQEEVGVAVMAKPGATVTIEAIRDACVSLAPFKRPVHLYLYDKQLPRGATGKILKKTIREDIKSGNIKPTAGATARL